MKLHGCGKCQERYLVQQELKMAGESRLMMNCRLSTVLKRIKVRRLEWAGLLIGMSDDRSVRKYFLGNQMEEEKQEAGG
jgi:predicted metalloprotease